jgi:hypothetical protein
VGWQDAPIVPDWQSAPTVDEKKQPQGPRLGPAASAVVRPLARAAIGIGTFVPDIAVAGANLIGGPIARAIGSKEQDIELPSSFWNRQLDRYTTKPGTTVGRVAEDVSSFVAAGTMAGLAQGEEAAAAAGAKGRQALTRVTTKAAEDAQSAGYKLPPSYIGGVTSRIGQTIAGGPKLEKEFSVANEENTDRLAKLALGLHPDHELSEETLDVLKTEAYRPYEEVRKVGTMPPDPEFDAAVKAAGGRFAQRSGSYGGGYRYEAIAKEKQPYLDTKEVDAGETLDEVRALRDSARRNLKNYDPEKNALGQTQRQIADAMEARIDRFAQKFAPNLMGDLRMARSQLAKIRVVEDSLGAGGHVRAGELAKLLKANYPLTDQLRTIAVTAKNFPKAMQHTAAQGESGAFSAIDYMLGGSGIVTGHPAVTGLSLVRPAIRGALKTDIAQKAMLGDLGVAKTAKAATVGAGLVRHSQALAGDDEDDSE